MPTIATYRHQAAVHQSFRCFYCNMPMWESNAEAFIREYGLTRKQADYLQCTGEHLHTRCDGGPNIASNIVAACKHCNQTRHKAKKPLTAEKYQKKVDTRVKRGHWLPENIVTKISALRK